jgi:glutathionylspermidine synthase
MERLTVTPRPDKAEKLEAIGLSFHGWDDYWKEDAAYKFSAEQVDVLEEATQELQKMCQAAVQFVIDNNRLGQLGIPEAYWGPIKESWERRDTSLYGRFDLAYTGEGVPKMLEFNADTPTSLLESAVAQWYWMEDEYPYADQFNSLHEKLVDRWKTLPAMVNTIHFASVSENEEDWVCCHYLMETAVQAGYEVKHLYIEDLGYDSETLAFVDVEGKPIQALFKLYPWEWMMREEFGDKIATSTTRFIEPMWKAVLSNKAMLAILWEMFPDSPYLLPAYFSPNGMTSYAKKPFFSREGANVELYQDGQQIAADEGPYGSEGHVYQELTTLPEFDGKYAVIGSWLVGDEPAGMCIREDSLKITTNMSNFVPHFFI